MLSEGSLGAYPVVGSCATPRADIPMAVMPPKGDHRDGEATSICPLDR